METLDSGLHHKPTLICDPAGLGKTTLHDPGIAAGAIEIANWRQAGVKE
jgi:hypothetical protein